MVIFIPILFLFISQAYSECEDCTCTDSLLTNAETPPPQKVYLFNSTEDFKIMEVGEETDAKCSDGTNYKFLYSFGSRNLTNNTKFMFLFEAGGYCGMDNDEFLSSCLSRQSVFLGTSSTIGGNGSVYSFNYSLGFFSSNPALNPMFANWTKIQINYCDGTFFQGYKEDPVEYEGSEIWFRGYNNTMAVFKYAIEHWGLKNAEEVILSGSSSGGQAVYFWLPYVRSFLPQTVKLRGLTDAGFFLDLKNINSDCYLFRYHIQQIANYTDSSEIELFDNCTYRDSEIWKCFFPEYIYHQIQDPIFIGNSQNDFESLRTSAGVHCLGDETVDCPEKFNETIIEVREKFLNTLLAVKLEKPEWGFWLRRCIEHIYMYSHAWGDNMTSYNAENDQFLNLQNAVNAWYQTGEAVSYIDLADWMVDCDTN